MPGAEKIIERNIRRCLKERKYLSYKIHVGQYGPEGFPDLLAVKNGVTSYFEIKQPGKEPTPIQLFRLRELCQAGCVARPVWSCTDVIQALDEGVQVWT